MSKKGICSQCGKGPREIRYLHPETKQHICKTCYQKIKKGICSQCGKGPREIRYLHPETKQHICNTCYRNLKKGICSQCGKGPREIHYLHPETKQPICNICYRNLKKGICSQCGKGLREICYLHSETKQHICRNCYKKIKAEKDFLQWFRNLAEFQAAGWIVDTFYFRESKRMKQLNLLIELELEKVKAIFEEIQNPAYPNANRIFKEFLKTEEGKKLRSLIEEI